MMQNTYYRLYKPRRKRCANPGCEREFFLQTNRNQDYCTDRCRRLHKYGTRICPACTKSFVPQERRGAATHYCSRECYEKGGN